MKNTIKLLLFLVALLSVFPASGQKKGEFWNDLNSFLDMRIAKNSFRWDSNYVARYPYRWEARAFVSSPNLRFDSTFGDGIHLATDMIARVGVGISFRGLGINIAPAIGKKHTFDLSLSGYGRHFGIEYSWRSGRGLNSTSDKNQLLIANKLSLLYSFNPRFSYAAALKQTRLQRRSTGSVLAAFNWSMWDLLYRPDKEVYGSIFKSNYFFQRFLLGVGYGYNLVLGQRHWLIHASVLPMWSVYEMQGWRQGTERERKNYPYGHIAFMGSARASVCYYWGTRWSLSLNGQINEMGSMTRLKRQSSADPRFHSREWDVKLMLAFWF